MRMRNILRPRPPILSIHAHFVVCTIKNRTFAADGIQDMMVRVATDELASDIKLDIALLSLNNSL